MSRDIKKQTSLVHSSHLATTITTWEDGWNWLTITHGDSEFSAHELDDCDLSVLSETIANHLGARGQYAVMERVDDEDETPIAYCLRIVDAEEIASALNEAHARMFRYSVKDNA